MFRQAEGQYHVRWVGHFSSGLGRMIWKEEECKGDPTFPSAWEPGEWCSHWHKGEIRTWAALEGTFQLF